MIPNRKALVSIGFASYGETRSGGRDFILKLAETFAIGARLYAEIAAKFAVAGISQDDYMRLCRRAEEPVKNDC